MSADLIGLMVATFNEEENVQELYEEIVLTFAKELPDFDFNILFIDNSSTDGTQQKLREIAKDPRVKCIFNIRNFGPNRSAYHGMLNCPGDAVVMMCADFQDPPELLPQLIRQWKSGKKTVMARKADSKEGLFMKALRKLYYRALIRSNEVYGSISNCTGFGIYDRAIIDRLAKVNDAYPFFRGIVAEVADDITYVDYIRPRRKRGSSSMNFFALWDEGIVGLMNNSKLAIRCTSLIGIVCAFGALCFAVLYLALKLIFWDDFPVGIAPIVISQLMLFGILLICVGVLGEYIGAIYSQVLSRDLIYERERINFDVNSLCNKPDSLARNVGDRN